MSSQNPKPTPDLENAEHDETAQAKKVLAIGKTTSGDYIPLLVDSNGVVQT